MLHGGQRSCWWLCCVLIWTVGVAVWACAWMHQLPAWAGRLRSGNGPQLVDYAAVYVERPPAGRFKRLFGGIHPQKCFDDPVAVLSTKIILARQL